MHVSDLDFSSPVVAHLSIPLDLIEIDVKLIVPLILIKILGIEMCAIKREKIKHGVGRSSGDLHCMLQ